MQTFRGEPFPGCTFHERPLMRVAFAVSPDPTQATAFALSCPDCSAELLRSGAAFIRTPDIPISRDEFDQLPANPNPFGLAPDGSRIELLDECIHCGAIVPRATLGTTTICDECVQRWQDDACSYCGQAGHHIADCPVFIAEQTAAAARDAATDKTDWPL